MTAGRSEEPRPAVVVRSKVWVERGGAVVMSDYLAALLEAIGRHGSVTAAAEELDLPVRTAWKKLREMEAAAGVALLESGSGGAAGGGSTLTSEAEAMIAAYHRLAEPLTAEVERRFKDEGRWFRPSE